MSRRLCYIFVLMISGSALAQRAAPSASRSLKESLEAEYARHTSRLLSRYSESSEYFVDVSVTPKQAPRELPYSPRGYTPNAISLTRPKALKTYVSKVEFSILVSQRFNQTARDRLQRIIKNYFLLSDEQASVSFNDLNLPVKKGDEDLRQAQRDLKSNQEKIDELNREQGRLESDLREKNSKIDRLNSEKERLNSEKQRLNSEKERLNSEKAGLEREMSDVQNRLDQLKGETASDSTEMWTFAGTAMGIGLLVFLALLLLTRSIGKSFQGVTKAIESFASSSAAAAPPPPPAVGDGDQGATKAVGRDSSTLTADAGNLQRHVRVLKKELQESLDESNELAVVTFVSQLLQQGDVSSAVVALELFGREVASRMYLQMNDFCQWQVARFMEKPVYDRPKLQIAMEVGEILKSKVLGKALVHSHGLRSNSVSERILKLDQQDLLSLAANMHPEHFSRLFAYLDTDMTTALLQNLYNHDEERFKASLQSLLSRPTSQAAEGLDKELLEVIDRELANAQADSQRPYLAFYEHVIGNLNLEASELALNSIAGFDERVSSYLRENIVTIQTFFSLESIFQRRILKDVKSLEVLALLSMFEEEYGQMLRTLVGERRLEMVQEESDRWEALSPVERKEITEEAISKIVSAIRNLKNRYSIAEIMRKEQETDGQQDLNAA